MDETDDERRNPGATGPRDRGRGVATDGRPYIVVLAVAPWTRGASTSHPAVPAVATPA